MIKYRERNSMRIMILMLDLMKYLALKLLCRSGDINVTNVSLCWGLNHGPRERQSSIDQAKLVNSPVRASGNVKSLTLPQNVGNVSSCFILGCVGFRWS